MLIKNLAVAVIGYALSIPILAIDAAAQSSTLFAVLNGGNECNGAVPPICGQGDPDGFGSASLIFPSASTICFAITVDNLAPITSAHIHQGATGVNGGVIISLVPPAAAGGGNPGTLAGCFGGLAAGVAASIVKNPQNFYVNVHNGAFPAGAVRGQLF